ncbi:Malonyl CoA acyl carrier protein transacylase [Polaromonas sp. CG9_12]|uniref:acyltransferase domain-containing protein n=1 Tax=Polaromonas sp. CG_9.11 TaxID=2787730 RepID=UPI0004DDDBBF|nr:acyltransferase domain-containing protein [Polaromonas sp. CG_9.11]MBG6075642.1 [acyl-carrier-protein] S-malonyltransferase [Polaromonas sp. CG_9.11]CDS52583.1 Malonyl CoA acyl carrier protein transacylase [Polaromonas sp. CG9_12]
MTLALLFPGQGIQHPDMLPWLDRHPLAAPVLARMADHVGHDWRARLGDEDWLSRNSVAQCLVTGVSLAAWSILCPLLPRPAVLAGYSVGELAAYSAAGVMDAGKALDLAACRAGAMDRCAAGRPAGLMAVSGLNAGVIDSMCECFGLAMAIRIGPDRCVLGGLSASLDAALPALAAHGAEVTRLRVRIASHTPWMTAAAAEIAARIAPMDWNNSQSIVANNVDGTGRRDAAGLKAALASQMASTVQWDRCMDTLAERQPRCVLEVGPGSSLSRMWQARYPGIPARAVDAFQSAQGAASWVRRYLT